MKGATQCARRLKTLMRKLQRSYGNVSSPAVTDPITQMLLGILARDTTETKARDALDRLRATVVDYNELRVIPPLELSDTLGSFPGARIKCEDISRALNKIFSLYHVVSLDHVASMDRKSMLALLEEIDGLDPYSRARIRLFAFEKHAFPLDGPMLTYARQVEIIDDKCSHAEAQAFLERHTKDGAAAEHFALLRKAAWSEMAAAIRRGEFEQIGSVPPDRTTRNMLQLIGSGGVIEVKRPQDAAKNEPPAEKAKPSKPRAAARGSTTKSRSAAKSAAKPRKPTASRKTTKSAAKSKTSRKTTRARKTTRRGSSKAKSA